MPGKPKLSLQARLLFSRLENDYADASEQEWDELREHMHDQMTLMSGGSPARRHQLVGEFDTVRDRCLSLRRERALRAELSAGRVSFERDRGDGLEQWRVAPAGYESAVLLVPAAGTAGHAGEVARAALLAGVCPSCHRAAALSGSVLDIAHNSRCPARQALE